MRKPKGKYAPGNEPWAILGIKEATFFARAKAEEKRGEIEGPANQAKRRALAIAAGEIVPDHKPVEAPASAPTEANDLVAGPEPKTVEVPGLGPVRVSRMSAESAPVPTATVYVSFRAPAAQHERMREMAFRSRRSLQDIVGAAVEAYLSQNGF